MVAKLQKKLSVRAVEQDYLLEYVNKELTPQVERLRLLTDALLSLILSGEGSPEGVVTASPSALYQQTDGVVGAQLWQKQTGTDTDTGWVAVL